MSLRLILATLLIPITLFGFQEPHYCKLADNITDQHILKMRDLGLVVNSTGGGFMGDINLITLGFQSQKLTSIEDARKMFVQGSQSLLKAINNDLPIQPYLHHRPFSIKDLDYSLSFSHDPNYPEAVAYVFNSGDSICYSSCFWNSNPIASWDRTVLKIIHEESYEDAIRIVESSDKVDSADQTPAVRSMEDPGKEGKLSKAAHPDDIITEGKKFQDEYLGR